MMAPTPEKTLDELTLSSALKLEDLVDRQALGEMLTSFYQLFGIPLRVFGDAGQLLADASEPQELYTYLNGLRRARLAMQDVVSAVKAINPKHQGEVSQPCVTGAVYRIIEMSYDE